MYAKRFGVILVAFLALGGCNDPEPGDRDASVEDSGTPEEDSDLGENDGDKPDSDLEEADGDSSETDSDVDSGSHLPEEICTAPIELYDTTSPTDVIGSGTPESCVESDLRSAVERGGVITFDCGPEPATINITETIELPIDRDTIIDGGGLITLDAGLSARHFYFEDPGWLDGSTRVVLQRLTFRNGQAPAGELFPQDPDNPLCAYGYKEGSGGVIFIRNGILHVIESEFYDNRAVFLGPDVGGGAIYVLGVPEVIISRSRFVGNRAASGGAVGMLFANPQIYNSVFENNTAEGLGMNSVEPGCPFFNHDEQGGAGGNGGALYFDGMNDDGTVYTICGSVFRNNRANELAGAQFRTPNTRERDLNIDRCLFDGNTARMGGVSFMMLSAVTVRSSTFMNNRSGLNIAGEEVGQETGRWMGGLWVYWGSLDVENSTFSDNQPTGLNIERGIGTIRNVTFVRSLTEGSFVADNSLFVDASCSSAFAGANNLQWPNGTECADGTTFADPQIGELGDNGGSTPTYLPTADSPVVGVGADCPDTDQRGEPRDSSSCAAGAVEP